MTGMKGASREATGALMMAPVEVGEWNASRPATPGRRMDRVDPLGGVGTRHQWPVALVQEQREGGRLCAPPGQAGVGAGVDDGQGSTIYSSGLCGSPGATHAGVPGAIAGKFTVSQKCLCMKELASAKTGNDAAPAKEVCGRAPIIMSRSMLLTVYFY
jgi:hypothetical protein